MFELCSFGSAAEFRKLCNIEFNGKMKENDGDDDDDEDDDDYDNGKKEALCFEPDKSNIYLYV